MAQKTGKGQCPHCKDGFVQKELHMGSSPPGFHCVICGWYEWTGFAIRKPAKHESADVSRQPVAPIKKSHKKIMKDIRREVEAQL